MERKQKKGKKKEEQKGKFEVVVFWGDMCVTLPKPNM